MYTAILQHTTTHCNTGLYLAVMLQCTQHVAVHPTCCSVPNVMPFSRCSHIATHCNTMQHAATKPSQNIETRQEDAINCNTLQHAAARCNMLQHSATRCTTLQHAATRCNTLQHAAFNTTTRVPSYRDPPGGRSASCPTHPVLICVLMSRTQLVGVLTCVLICVLICVLTGVLVCVLISRTE